MHRLLIPALAIMASCYRPRAEGACIVECNHLTAPGCPGDLECGTDDLCYDDVQCNLIDPGIDSGRDGITTDTSNADCYMTRLLGDVCPQSLRVDFIPSAFIDTNVDCDETLSIPGGEACLIAATTISLPESTLEIRGPRPLVLYSRETLVIPPSGILDLSDGGAGVGVGCVPSLAGSSNGTSHGGGAGGSLVGKGGSGGAPSGGMATMAPDGDLPTHLQGGCRGGAGSLALASNGGVAGSGGGGLQLISPSQIFVFGRIDAFGSGGSGASGTVTSSGGGGGGGSGGLVALDSPMVMFGGQSRILAHGGGGGGGVQGSATSGNGAPGNSPDGAAAMHGAAAGTGCGNGGAGSSDVSLFGTSASGATSASAAGGGGGGGAGGIFVNTVMTLTGGAQHPLATIGPPAI